MAEECRIEITHFYCFEYYEGEKKMVVELDFRDKVLHLLPCLRQTENPEKHPGMLVESLGTGKGGSSH